MPSIEDKIIELIGQSEIARDNADDGPDQFWTVALNDFAAEVVNRVLPDDPVAQEAVVRKAQAIGIDIGGDDRPARSGDNVINLMAAVRLKASGASQGEIAGEIGARIASLIADASAAGLGNLAWLLEMARKEADARSVGRGLPAP